MENLAGRTLASLLRHVREKSPFYRELYRELPADVSSIELLPVVEQSDFWAANTVADNRVMTSPMADGIVFRSGGTTGTPKLSVYARDEWNHLGRRFGEHLAANGLVAGDRVANLFYPGNLYGSFVFAQKIVEACPLGVLLLPIGPLPADVTVGLLRDLGATVLVGTTTTLLGVARYVEEQNIDPATLRIRMLWYGGEPFHAAERERVASALGGAIVRSICYSAIDTALLGYCDLGCAPGEFRCFDGDTILEILDEDSGKPLHDAGAEGRLVATQIYRYLMPTIRYPVGDRARWVDPPGTSARKYELLGRSDQAARVGPLTFSVEEVRRGLDGLDGGRGVPFQLVVLHEDGRDRLVVRLAGAGSALRDEDVLRSLTRVHGLYTQFVDEKKIHPIDIVRTTFSGLETNPRSGKLMSVVDRRFDVARQSPKSDSA